MVGNLEILPTAQTHMIDSMLKLYKEYGRGSSKRSLCVEHWQKKVAHLRHEMSSEMRQQKCKYWNLHSLVMSDFSLIATRHSHAKHSELLGRTPRVSDTNKKDLHIK